ncbi:MAG: flagellar basal body P-ring protein FlgI [Sphingomonadales bacterium]|jgi:flagellar P-ring protein precursor FlgI|nr:flagellar basal body P-ring protein FlgI [Sphingomonadales bacterium]MBK9005156.1 flagellar basal body P-ring protein FlgI [Sphingomonadales bacterium]MBK9267110.1 flagellar basal body P-ring protein FlgI [Sphingomonadales bacterium]MBP6433085.1 flagellar basal body P-ring protein FlgI [Sphingorhabdus sp.]
MLGLFSKLLCRSLPSRLRVARRAAALLLALLLATPANAERVKDLGQFQGLRANQLTGYGIVVGLNGTGDDSLIYATQAVQGTVSRFGLNIPPGVNPSLKNAAAVLVTAELPPFAKPGQRLDITVSAMGKAKSLRGGTLVMAPLYGADGRIYAMAQGNLVVGGLGVDAADGSKLSINIPSAGRIEGGATVERAVDTGFTAGEHLLFNLHLFDATNAGRIADAIDKTFGNGTASVLDGATVQIRAAQGGDARTRMIALIETLNIEAAQPRARVIVNARTGTVVINGAVRVGPAAVAHGKLIVKVDEAPAVVQPAPFGRGETAVEQASDISVADRAHPAFLIKGGANLAEIVDAINRIGVPPGDLVAILEALDQAGALTAELVII